MTFQGQMEFRICLKFTDFSVNNSIKYKITQLYQILRRKLKRFFINFEVQPCIWKCGQMVLKLFDNSSHNKLLVTLKRIKEYMKDYIFELQRKI